MGLSDYGILELSDAAMFIMEKSVILNILSVHLFVYFKTSLNLIRLILTFYAVVFFRQD